MSRMILLLRVLVWRGILSLKRLIDLYCSRPRPTPASFTRRISSSVGSTPGQFDLLFYTPKHYDASRSQNQKSVSPSLKRHPVLINFHGGGYTVGHASEDARWAMTVVEQTSAIVISVNYRLAPRYPFPTPIDDCVSAVLWIWQHADEYNLDISRTAFSGFSAGGNLTYTVAIRLQQELSKLKAEDRLNDVQLGSLVALITFYPGTDWTQTREQKRASNPRLIYSIPKRLYRIFDAAYLYPLSQLPDLSDPLFSPALASDELLAKSLPNKMVLITCSGDLLLAEGEKFRARLKSLGNRVDGYVVEGVPHAWDKMPSFGLHDHRKRYEAYRSATESLVEFWAQV